MPEPTLDADDAITWIEDVGGYPLDPWQRHLVRRTWGRAHPDDQFRPAPGTVTFRLRVDVSNFVARVPAVAYWPKDGRLHARLVRIQKESRDPFDDRISAMHSAYHRKAKGRQP